jgi:class 3 adenylate cyclase
MSATQAPLFLQRLLRLGLQAQDDEELRLGKTLLNLGSLLFVLAALVWLGACKAIDPGFPVAAAVTVPALALVNLALFAGHRWFAPYRFVQLGLLLAFPVVTQLGIGALPGTSGLALWGLLAPAAALLSGRVAGSTWWFAGFLLGTALSASLPPPGGEPGAFVALHIALVSSVLYLQLRYAQGRRGRTREKLADAHHQLRLEKERSERLLLNILPAPIAARLKDSSGTLADGHPEVVVMFADIVDYTRIASGMAPVKVFEMLNRIFCRFDELCEKRGLERIKTIGDGYMVAGGLHAHPHEAHAAMAALALDMQAALHDHSFTDGLTLQLRIGIASGPVVAGVVGRGRFIYDLWGDREPRPPPVHRGRAQRDPVRRAHVRAPARRLRLRQAGAADAEGQGLRTGLSPAQPAHHRCPHPSPPPGPGRLTTSPFASSIPSGI